MLDEENWKFLEWIKSTSAKRKVTLAQDTVLFRAQLGCDEICDEVHGIHMAQRVPYTRERMIPKPDRAKEGRVNPVGIPCLYLSTDMNTAMSETRPWIGSVVSVAQFKTHKPLKLIDCSADAQMLKTIELIANIAKNPADLENWIWGDINLAFSEPATRTEEVAEYAPTQILAEAFRSAGYDGIRYASKLGIGKNVALFALADAEFLNCDLQQVAAIDHGFEKADNLILKIFGP